MAKTPNASIGELNGGWKMLFKFCLVLFPPLCAVVGYSAVVLRDHDQRLMRIESVQQDRQMLVDEFRKMRDQLPTEIKGLAMEIGELRRALSELKEEAKIERAELRTFIKSAGPAKK